MKIGRNDPCPCGSHKKYKKCCLGKSEKEAMILGESIKSDLPEKVKEFLSKVEKETQKNIIFKVVPSLPAGMAIGVSFEGKNIIIDIVLKLFTSKTDLHRSLAHEATHGLLLFGKGYQTLVPKNGAIVNTEETELRNILVTMIDDIVVNYIIKQEGFAPFSEKYIPIVKKEIEFINQKKDFYASQYQIGSVFHSKFKILRYIMAWAFIEYFKLDAHTVSILKEYLDCFKDNSPKEYEECEEIIKLLETHDIFLPDNHKIVCERITKLWGLDEKMGVIKMT
jgi:hypothetical protein